jgi:hypothetical protein
MVACIPVSNRYVYAWSADFFGYFYFRYCKDYLSIIQTIAMHVFEQASAPSTSPFAYAGTLIGLLVAVINVAQEFIASLITS